MVNLHLHLGQIAVDLSLSLGVSKINSLLHFGHVVRPFIFFNQKDDK